MHSQNYLRSTLPVRFKPIFLNYSLIYQREVYNSLRYAINIQVVQYEMPRSTQCI